MYPRWFCWPKDCDALGALERWSGISSDAASSSPGPPTRGPCSTHVSVARRAGRAGGSVPAQRLYLTPPSSSVGQSERFRVVLQPLGGSAWGPGAGAPPPLVPWS